MRGVYRAKISQSLNATPTGFSPPTFNQCTTAKCIAHYIQVIYPDNKESSSSGVKPYHSVRKYRVRLGFEVKSRAVENRCEHGAQQERGCRNKQPGARSPQEYLPLCSATPTHQRTHKKTCKRPECRAPHAMYVDIQASTLMNKKTITNRDRKNTSYIFAKLWYILSPRMTRKKKTKNQEKRWHDFVTKSAICVFRKLDI